MRSHPLSDMSLTDFEIPLLCHIYTSFAKPVPVVRFIESFIEFEGQGLGEVIHGHIGSNVAHPPTRRPELTLAWR